MSNRLDPLFFKPFVDGTVKTLATQCKVECVPQKPYFKNDAPPAPCSIAGVIGLTSKEFSGSLSLGFPAEVFLLLMSNMLGENFPEITKDLEDGAAELLNIIFGQAKIALNSQGHSIQKAIPSIIRGEKLVLSSVTKNPVIVLPFQTAAGIFFIEISTEDTKTA